MDYTIFLPVLISFALSVIMGPLVIPVLRRMKMGQTEREEGVKSHLKKAGHPHHGRGDHPDCRDGHVHLLYRPVSQHHPGPFCDTRVRADRLSGRLPEGGAAAL